MPQVRKRKTKESIPSDVNKKGRKEDSDVSKNVSQKKQKEVSATPKTKRSKASVKRKKTESPLCSGEESNDESVKIKKAVRRKSSTSKKGSKRSIKENVNDEDQFIKEELEDSENLHNSTDSGISSETVSDTVKKITIKSEPSSSFSSDVKQNRNEIEIESVKIKKTAGRKSSTSKKGSKRSIKENVKDEDYSIKEELEDSENLHNSTDCGISSETVNDTVKKITVKSEPSSSFSNDVKQNRDDSSSSESDWEEVEDQCETNSLEDYKPDIPKEGVEITIDCPELRIRKRVKKQFDEREWIRLHINRMRKDNQLSVHKTHLLCLLAHGMYVNKILNCDTIKALALSLIPSDILSITSGRKVDKIDVYGIEKIVAWFRNAFSFENNKCVFLNLFTSLVKSFETTNAMNGSEYNLLFIILARILGFKVRFCVSLYPLTYKATNLLKKPNSKIRHKKSESTKESKEIDGKVSDENKSKFPENSKKSKKAKCEEKPQNKKSTKEIKNSKLPKQKKQKLSETKKKTDTKNIEKISRPRRSTGKNYKMSSDEDDNDSNDKDFKIDYNGSDEDLEIVPKYKRGSNTKRSNRKVLSSDSETSSLEQSAFDSENIVCWAEMYSKPDKLWVSIECANNVINKPYEIEKLALKPVTYILTYDNESLVKDVTRRYCSEYMTSTVKLRVDPDWWEETLEPFLPPNSQQNKAEEKKLDEVLVNKPLPTTIQGFKNHPLYALKRHLLKFEAIYPPDAPPVGFMRSEPVYARDCVHQLHSRETWLKEARVVRIGEQPYKIVKARPKWDKIAAVLRTDLPLEIFGHWQTEQYEPPIAVNGKVPRNEYGNVELFKSCMLPRGTVHLQLPGLNRIAKKLGIDCSPAVVGFDGHKGSVHPVFDGFVICEEFKDTILAAWDEEQVNARKREEEKRTKRIYGNWKKLIKGLLIREKIKLKYGSNSYEKSKPTETKESSSNAYSSESESD